MFLLQIGELTVGQILEFLLGPFGSLMILIIIIYTGTKRLWVFGWYADELKRRNERLENRIDQISGTTKSIASAAETTAKIAEKKAEVVSE